MAQINQLPLIDSVSGGDQLPVFSTGNGDARRLPVSSLLSFFQKAFVSQDLSPQLVTPGTGFNINVAGSSAGASVWLIIQPAGTLASGTITLPLNTTLADGQEVLVVNTQQITALTVAANGATAVYGSPSTLAAQDTFRLRYYAATNSWYRIS